MKVLIIGSGGFLGKNLFNYLLDQNIDVIGCSSTEHYGICADTGLLSSQFSIPPDTHTVIYLSQSPYYRQVPEMAEHLLNVNVVSAVKVAEIARRANVKHFIYTSTGNVYAPSFEPLSEDAPVNRNNWYALSKIHAEESLSLFRNDFDVTIMRLFGVYGTGQTDKLIPNLFNTVLQRRKVFVDRNSIDANDIDGLRISLINVVDLVKIFMQCITSSNLKSYLLNISSHEVVSIRHITQLISQALNIPVDIEISDRYRQSSLIANIQLLQATFSPVFTPIEKGIQNMAVQYKVLR
ncbi:MAG: NAD(P)-dependent oxidoreductase [Pseudanabaena sp. M046S1SP1A06QC]|jgi:UDP-glucose 4-epimerase|nr:NAD(P)-dependent oxidoreductase [Pseudanabaena sp. M046S1SP1A06QC]